MNHGHKHQQNMVGRHVHPNTCFWLIVNSKYIVLIRKQNENYFNALKTDDVRKTQSLESYIKISLLQVCSNLIKKITTDKNDKRIQTTVIHNRQYLHSLREFLIFI